MTVTTSSCKLQLEGTEREKTAMRVKDGRGDLQLESQMSLTINQLEIGV